MDFGTLFATRSGKQLIAVREKKTERCNRPQDHAREMSPSGRMKDIWNGRHAEQEFLQDEGLL